MIESRVSGAAPLRVHFRATCTAQPFRWSFGDGRHASGRSVWHTYAAGEFRPVVSTGGGVHRLPAVRSIRLRLLAPHRARYGERVTFRVRVRPLVPVLLAGRRFRHGKLDVVVTRTAWTAVARGVPAHVTIRVRPRLDVRLAGRAVVGSPLHVVAILRPRSAGEVRVRVDGQLTRHVATDGPRAARIVVTTIPRPSWAPVGARLSAEIAGPALSLGAHGRAVLALEKRLSALHYALERIDGVFGEDDADAIIAFQEVHGLPRTGAVAPALWTRLEHAGVPRARAAGDHVEVDKTRQVLFLVRSGAVALVVRVSTGATGNTPVGTWHVYSKVPGWSWVLWYPSYFLRGFAIHGYPDVPTYPASHGCVRVPMWVATRLYAGIALGSAVEIFA